MRFRFSIIAAGLFLAIAISGAAFAQEISVQSTEVRELLSRVSDPQARVDLERNISMGNIATMEELKSFTQDMDLLPLDQASSASAMDQLNDSASRSKAMESRYSAVAKLSGRAFRDELQEMCSNHTSLGYNAAKSKMYTFIDAYNGKVEGVYTGKMFASRSCKLLPEFPVDGDYSSESPDEAFEDDNAGKGESFMNCEHTWPQSFFEKQEPMRSDIWHLYPTDSVANNRRSSYPFGIVIGEPIWSENGSKLGYDAKGRTVFEPRDCHKGNVARSMFYFSVRYNDPIDNLQEASFRKWHAADPVDARERERANRIESLQNNRNPFIDHPEFTDRISDF